MTFQTGSYGELLYKDEESWKKKRNDTRLYTGCFLIGGIMILIGLPFSKGIDSFILILLGGIINILIGLWFASIRYSEFRIYQQGIRVSISKIPFIHFSEIDHISKFEGQSLVIVLKSGLTYMILETNELEPLIYNSGPSDSVSPSVSQLVGSGSLTSRFPS